MTVARGGEWLRPCRQGWAPAAPSLEATRGHWPQWLRGRLEETLETKPTRGLHTVGETETPRKHLYVPDSRSDAFFAQTLYFSHNFVFVLTIRRRQLVHIVQV